MLQEPDQVSDEDVQEAASHLEGCSPELVAACIPDYTAAVVSALMARWDPTFAATVRQHVDLDGWVRIIEASQDVDASINWLRSDADLSLSKQVVERIGKLDKSRGQGMLRAAKLMKGLRQAQVQPKNPPPNITKLTKPTVADTTPSSASSKGPANLWHPSAPARPPAVVVSDTSAGEEAKLLPATAPVVPTPTLLHPPSLGLGGRGTEPRDANSRQIATLSPPVATASPSSAAESLQAPVHPVPAHLSTPPQSPNATSASLPPSAELHASAQLPVTLSGAKPLTRASTPPVLPSRGKDQRAFGPGPNADTQLKDAFFLKTPVPQSLLAKPDPDFSGRHLEDIPPQSVLAADGAFGPAIAPATDPKPPPTPLPPPKLPNDEVPMPPDAEAPAKISMQLLADCLSPEVKSKHVLSPIPHSNRSPTPWDEEQEEESGLDSGDDYLPESSSKGSVLGEDDSGDQRFDNKEDNGDDGDASEGERGENSEVPKPGSKKKRKRHPKMTDDDVPTSWTWSKEQNDRRVQKWNLEDAIDLDPTALHPVRTEWMYEARLKDLSEEDYEDMMHSEHHELMAIPPACRSVVGQMYLQRSKGDWEFRVVLTCLTWRYTQVKIKKEKATADGDRESIRDYGEKMAKILDEGMRELFGRFPDVDPEHERRQIASQLGKDAVAAYIQSIRTKVSSDAGRMSTTWRASGGTLAMLESNSAGRKALGILDILGKKRKDVAFHLWGGSSSGGRAECDKRIEDRMQKDLFQTLGEKEQLLWEDKAKNLHLPQTDEERQCLVDAVLPYLFRLLAQLSTHTSLHFILLASGQGTSNVPVLVHEFSESTVDQLSFFDENAALAQRIRSDYFKYAIERHNTGQEEVVEGLPVMHTPDEAPAEPPMNEKPAESKKHQRVSSPIKPFRPNLAVVKSRSQRVAYATTWFLDAGVHILGYRPVWDFWSKNISKYILTDRLPDDPLVEGKRLEIIKPTMMPDERFDALWKFLIESYDGSLPAEKRFMFRVETVHKRIPAPTAAADASVHQAAINSTKTVPMKKKSSRNGASKKVRKAARSAAREPDELLDAPGMEEEIDAAFLATALADAPKSRRKRVGKNPLRIDSPEGEDATMSLAEGVATPGETPPREAIPEVAILENAIPEDSIPEDSSPGEATATTSSESSAVAPNVLDGPALGGPGVLCKSDQANPDLQPNVGDVNRPTLESHETQKPTAAKGGPQVQRRLRPRRLGVLLTVTETLAHSNFPKKDSAILARWQRQLVDLASWGRRMGLGISQGKVLRYRGSVKKEWASMLPTGLDSAFCILQMWAARQEGSAPSSPTPISPKAALERVNPNHPIALAINLILDPTRTLPSVKVFNVQLGASPAANDGFFDFLEGSLAALVQNSLQSEDAFLDGEVDVMQLLRLATFVGGTGFIRDLSTISEHAARTSVLVDRLNVFLASMSLVRYYHVILGGVAEAFCRDDSIVGGEKVMWLTLLDAWVAAVRSMARAVIVLRSDDAPDVARPSSMVDAWRYRVAVAHHIHDQPKDKNLASLQTLEKMTSFLRAIQTSIAGSTEIGPFNSQLDDRLELLTVRRSIDRWEAESNHPGVISVTDDAQSLLDETEAPPKSATDPGVISFADDAQSLLDGTEAPPESATDPAVVPPTHHQQMDQDDAAGSSVEVGPAHRPEAPEAYPPGGRHRAPAPEEHSKPEMPADEPAGPSSALELPCEDEDLIWPNGDGPAQLWKASQNPDGSQAMHPGSAQPLEASRPLIPAVRPAPPSPTSAPKAKRQRLIPNAPPHWQAENQDTGRRQLRSTRLPLPEALPATAPTAGNRRQGTRLAVVTETQAHAQAAMNTAASRRQSSRLKRPPA